MIKAPPEWPFDQEPRAAALTAIGVLKQNLPILNVVHYSEDHSWAFTCGTTNATEDGRLIAMEEALKIDPTLRAIADLPPGWRAWRDYVGGAWSGEP
jgi:hypothetical protein